MFRRHQHRQPGYSQFDYFGEFGLLTQTYESNSKITRKKSLIAPSVQGGDWGDNPEVVWDTGFVQEYDQWLSALSVEQ